MELEKERSLLRQRTSREVGRTRRSIRQEEREKLSQASSTKERRTIKEEADAALEAIKDLSTDYNPTNNKTDYESDISQRGFDQFNPPEASQKDDVGAGISGFNEETLTICVNGQPEDRIFLTRQL